MWSNANCTVTLNLDMQSITSDSDSVRWLATTTCKFMKTEYGSLEEAYNDFMAGTRNSEKEVLNKIENAA